MHIINVLNHLLRLELIMQRLYIHFETVFGHESAAASLFHELSMEEKSHADLIRYQLRIVNNNLNIFYDIDYDAAPLVSLMNQISSIISADQPPKLHEAISFSITAERSAGELHFRTAIAESNPEMGEVIKNLGAFYEAHNIRLGSFAIAMGIHE